MVPVPLPGRAAGGALKKAAIAIAALAAAFCLVPLPPRSTAARLLSQSHGEGALRAGAAKVRIALPEHPVLAGYAGHRRAGSSAEPVHVRAIALEAGSARAILVSVDTLLIPPGFFAPDGCALVAATHTHTGPGGLWDNAVAGWMGAGSPDKEQQAALERALREALGQAVAALGPAELQMSREMWPQGPARPRSEGRIDPELVAMRLRRPSGEIVATAVIYAMHPTSAPRDVLSADWPGQLETGAPVLVLQGAGGNTTWERDKPIGPMIAIEVERLLASAPALTALPLDCEVSSVSAPGAQASMRVPWLLRRAASNLIQLAFDPSATQTRLRIGPLALLGVPGEPVGELGLAARPEVLVGLSGGYLGYVETRERWERGGGESAKTYFGPQLARALGLEAR